MSDDVPLELWLLREIDFSCYTQTDTGRRFNRINGAFIEVDPNYKDDYACAQFGPSFTLALFRHR